MTPLCKQPTRIMITIITEKWSNEQEKRNQQASFFASSKLMAVQICKMLYPNGFMPHVVNPVVTLAKSSCIMSRSVVLYASSNVASSTMPDLIR